MQRPIWHRSQPFLILLLLAAGCNPTPPAAPTASLKPLDGQTLTIGCADPAMAALVNARAAGWGAATGASATPAPPDSADLLVIRPAELGALAVAGQLAPLPAEFRALDHPLQRARMIEVYRDTLSGWGGTAVALPVGGDGFVLVTRRDVLDRDVVRAAGKKNRGRDPSPPGTYEEWAELGELVGTAVGQPALPALPADDATLLVDFTRIVACYDRPAALGGGARPALSLYYSLGTLEPRLTTPGFVKAAEYLARTRRLRPAGTADPVAALNAGAVAAVLSLRDLARLPRENGAVAARFTLSPLPGTRTFFDNNREQETRGRGNYVPFVGAGSWLAVVRVNAAHPGAAWSLAAELAGSGSQATLADSAVGSGPFRRDDLEAARESVWLGYRFSAVETKHLADALGEAAAVNVVNAATVLRTPDQAARMTELAKGLRRIAAGDVPPAIGLAQVEATWRARDAALSPGTPAAWKRRAANLP